MPHSRDIEMHVEDENIKEKSLNDLFSVLKEGGPQVPWQGRNLPKSFFSYPSGNSSVQNSSVESLNRMTPSTGSGPILSPSQSGKTYPPESYIPPPGSVSNVVPSHIHHSKTNSSPARLQASLAAGAKMINAEHNRHVSDLSTNYNVNHNVPAMGHFHSTEPLCYRNSEHLMHNHTTFPQHQPPQPSPKESQVNLNYQYSSLPDGWQLAMHNNGSVYFIDHNNQRTSWYDPRIPESFQQWGMSIVQLEECHVRYMRHVQQQQQHHSPQQHQHTLSHQQKHQLDSHLMEQFQAVNLASHPPAAGYTPPGGATPGAAFSPAPAPPPHPSTACCYPGTQPNQPTTAHVHPGHATAIHPSVHSHWSLDSYAHRQYTSF